MLLKLHYQFMNILVRKDVAKSKPQFKTDLYFSSYKCVPQFTRVPALFDPGHKHTVLKIPD